ncbi:hypothetical protein Hanom_Chr16g01434501 [Helianthus anomalus]
MSVQQVAHNRAPRLEIVLETRRYKKTLVALISVRRQLHHDLHLAADDRADNKDNGQATWIQSMCTSSLLAQKHQRSWQRRQNTYSLMSTSKPKAYQPISFYTTPAINRDILL